MTHALAKSGSGGGGGGGKSLMHLCDTRYKAYHYLIMGP